jgi:cobalamin-dependent methionine synthase I
MAGLKWCQGKPIVNSISLKVGKEFFKEDATLLRKHGVAVVVIVDDVHNHLGLPFLNVGERCNISGSIKFKKLMMAGNYSAAMDIAKKQVDDGAHVIDINVEDGMLDGLAAMQKFMKIAVTEPEIAT